MKKWLKDKLFWLESVDTIYLALLIFVLFAVISQIPYKEMVGSTDLSKFLNNTLRYYNGDLPYRDFWLLFPPGEVVFPFIIYKLFGLNINYVLISSAVSSALASSLYFVLAKILTQRNSFGLLAALMFFFNGIVVHYDGGYFYIQMFTVFLITSAIFFFIFIKNNQRKYLVISGIMMGFAFFFRLFESGPAFLATIISLLAFHFRYKDKKQTLINLVSFLLPIILVLGILYIPFYGIINRLTDEIVVQSVDHSLAYNNPSIGKTLNSLFSLGLVDNPQYVGSSVIAFLTIIKNKILLVFPFIILLISTFVLFRSKKTDNYWLSILFFSIWAFLTLPKPMQRPGFPYMSYVFTPAFILIFLFLDSNKHFADVKFLNNTISKIIFGLLIFVLLLPTLVRPIYIYNEASKTHYIVTSSNGHIIIDNKDNALEVQSLINDISRRVTRDDHVFILPLELPPVYAMTNFKNPTYYDVLLDPISRPNTIVQQKMCDDILNNNTKIVVNYITGSDDYERINEKLPVLKQCVEENFVVSKKIGKYTVMSRLKVI